MSEPDDQPVVLFDGVCNLCTRSVQFIIKRDPKKHFRFASLQSDEAKHLLAAHQASSDLSSIQLIEGGRLYDRSSAALRICRHLNGLWPLLFGFIVIPKVLRDMVYNWIARNRYAWFGKTESCMLPSPETADRFL
ncbi:MAG: putative DCC family thiol-disulfide oxidoreductase YuxK [Kiritimatiellia bacterium]